MSEGLDVIGDESEIWEAVVSGKISSSTSLKTLLSQRFQFSEYREDFDRSFYEGERRSAFKV